MPEAVWEIGEWQQKEVWQYVDFSSYIQALIRADSGFQPAPKITSESGGLSLNERPPSASSAAKKLEDLRRQALRSKKEDQLHP